MASSSTSRPIVPTPPEAGGTPADAAGGDASTLQRGVDAAGQHAAATVDATKEEAGQVLRSATEHAQTLLDSAGGELRAQGEAQAGRVASSLSGMSDELRHFADDANTSSPLSDVARTMSEATGRVARRIEDAGPDGVLQDMARYGRNHPVKFVAIAASAGFVAGRILRGSDTDALRRSISDGAGSASDPEGSEGQTSGRAPEDGGEAVSEPALASTDPALASFDPALASTDPALASTDPAVAAGEIPTTPVPGGDLP